MREKCAKRLYMSRNFSQFVFQGKQKFAIFCISRMRLFWASVEFNCSRFRDIGNCQEYIILHHGDTLLTLFKISVFAPASRSSLTITIWPCSTAWNSADFPSFRYNLKYNYKSVFKRMLYHRFPNNSKPFKDQNKKSIYQVEV